MMCRLKGLCLRLLWMCTPEETDGGMALAALSARHTLSRRMRLFFEVEVDECLKRAGVGVWVGDK